MHPHATAALTLISLGTTIALGAAALQTSAPNSPLLPTGKRLSPLGEHVPVGSWPAALALSPDGRHVVVASIGTRCRLTVLDATTGKETSHLDIKGRSPSPSGRSAGLYVGLAFSPDGGELYASRGSDHRVGVYRIDSNGSIVDSGFAMLAEHAAGVAVDKNHVFVAANHGIAEDGLKGWLSIGRPGSTAVRKVSLPGYPFGVVAVDGKAYVGSEQDGSLHLVDPNGSFPPFRIPVGDNPAHLTASPDGKSIYVSNTGSDTISVVDTATNRTSRTISVRPSEAKGIPSASPLGSALSPDGRTLYVALADLNAVGVVDTARGTLRGLVPAGWYPTAVAVTLDGKRLFVANAKGTVAQLPNGSSRGYIQTLFEGTVATIDIARATADLGDLTKQVLANNGAVGDVLRASRLALRNPGIEHVIYVVKENRTYDQVLGDLPVGNGDPSLTLFPREVTPNQHALAERFVLLDNFHCTAEVSGNGWNASTAGSANGYVERNVAYGYSGKDRPYDYEGTNNGVAPDRAGLVDVGRSPGGYLWDKALEKGLTLRNFGMFTDDVRLPRRTAEEGAEGLENRATKKALAPHTSSDYRQYDLTFADSEAWVLHGLPPAPRQKPSFGPAKDPSRITTWRREYLLLAEQQRMPSLMLVRLGNDHTAGTSPGMAGPKAMVADNDFALGQLVETVSHGPYWRKTAIFVVEDDAQNGYDHVDAHRSIAFVISPFVPKSSKDSRFFNTDSVLHTIACLLGTDPMTLADATAPVLAVFGKSADNNAPYDAILPARRVVAEVNRPTAYGARESARWIDPAREESAPDEMLNRILWKHLRGSRSSPPARRRSGIALGEPD